MNFLKELNEKYPQLDPILDDIAEALLLLSDCVGGGGTILTCGNGGSAADAEHIVGELMKGFHSKRPLSTDDIRPFVDALPNDGVTIAKEINLKDLNYWNVDLQEAYFSHKEAHLKNEELKKKY